MTKSTITRERLQELAAGQSGFNLRTATHEESQELARMALAAMDSEPVIADCDPEVYEKGVSACLLVIPKETAEVICKGISAATGCKVDWHYIGGRVHIKALQAAPQEVQVSNKIPVAVAVAMINAARDITVAKINAKGAKFDGYTTSVNWFDRSMKEVREAVKAVLPDIEREAR
ncbi:MULTISPECIES: hypothetical protein [Klebsiella/Raoultella group]|uniref:hypothetical protein n=1 Tax=Klebsiella/Raoultella group TaxID=2890311 RepID=UPI002B05BC2B|nr:hypothetical protein [Klebsiella quasipneumoniae]